MSLHSLQFLIDVVFFDHVSQAPPPILLLHQVGGLGDSKIAQLVQGLNDFLFLEFACSISENQVVTHTPEISAALAPNASLLNL